MPEDEADVNYSVIYYIHADSDYLYHTPEGKAVRENSEVLASALNAGKAALTGEVFIYYQRPEKKVLGLFPRKSSRFYHYINGEPVNRVKFRHADKKKEFLTTEVQLMNRYRAQNRTVDHQNYFLYFGHEIPSEKGQGYYQSLPGIDVNTGSFARGIQNFLPSDEDRFALVVLSTCNNGTPSMADLLMPFSDAMLASPQNLHLSHIDSERMDLLEKERGTSSIHLGRQMAEQTFHRLESTVQTAITLALYNFEDIQSYINDLTKFTAADNNTYQLMQFEDNTDCAELSLFDADRYSEGVEAWYKPPRFGRRADRLTHSGWGCKPALK